MCIEFGNLMVHYTLQKQCKILLKMAISHTSLSAILRIERGHIQSHKKGVDLKCANIQNKNKYMYCSIDC